MFAVAKNSNIKIGAVNCLIRSISALKLLATLTKWNIVTSKIGNQHF